MEYHLKKQSVTQPRYVLDTAAEQPVDVELTLPDYCPDIERVLSCSLHPKIYLSIVSGDRVNIEGGACVRVMYVDGERGCLRSYEYTQPFSESIPLKGTYDDCVVYAEPKPEYLNCRALSPRKLSLHGAFSLCVKVAAPSQAEYCAYDDDDLQVKNESLEVSELCGMCSDSFSVQEDIPVSSKSGISALLSHRLTARITELKAISGKMMLSAELKLELMYLCGVDKPEPECMSYSIPVSRVIDCDGVEEDAVMDAVLRVAGYDLHLSDDALDGSALLSLDAKLSFNAMCYKERGISVLSDAFSTDREVELREEPFSCRGGIVCRSCTDVGKAEIAVDDEIGRVIDVHCEKLQASYGSDSGILTKLCAGILYENTDGEIRYVERDAEFRCEPEISEGEEVMSLRPALDSLSYRLKDSRHMELRAELSYRLTLSSRRSCPSIVSVSADEDAPETPKDDALILYYAESGDSVWDIGKRFCSRPADIIAENGLEGDSVEDGVMLLIPV